MKGTKIQHGLLWLTAAALITVPISLFSQTGDKAPPEKHSASQSTDMEKPAKAGPFRGKLAAIDKVAKTITVGKRTFQITSETKLKKAGKPATLEEGVVGEAVSGYIKPSADGKLVATTVNFGPKAAGDSVEKPKSSAEKEKQTK
jgi:hypothetical protein